MRILHLDTGRELRGGQRQLLLLTRGLRDRGHDQVILARSDGAVYAQSNSLGYRTLPVGLWAIAHEAHQADVTHAHDARSHTLAALAAPGRPLVVSRRVAFPISSSPLSRWKYSQAACFLAVSEFVKEQLLAAGIDAGKISVVYDGVKPPAPSDPEPREPFVLAPATSDPQKGSALATEACRAAGADLRFSAELERDLPRAALFLYLTHSEGLGSGILLAMAHGTPVVATRVGGIPEIVEHGRTGLLVDNTPASVTAAIQSVLADPASAAARAAAARAQLLARFTDVIMVNQTEQAYRIAASRRSAAEVSH